MKKFLCILIILTTLCGITYASQTFEVETKYGIKTVVILDGYTAEEVLCQVAKAYYELNEEHKVLITEYQELSDEVKEYIKSNEELRTSYNDIQDKYQTLVSLQNKDSFTDNFRLYINMDSSLGGNSLSLGVNGGIMVFEKIMLGGGLRVNSILWGSPQFSIQLGFLF